MKFKEISYVPRDNQNNLLVAVLSLGSKLCKVIGGVSEECGCCDLVMLSGINGSFVLKEAL